MRLSDGMQVSSGWISSPRVYSIVTIVSLMWVIGLADACLAADKQKEATGGGTISILRKLEFSKVGFSVRSQPQYEQALRERALARLKASGLEPVKASYKSPVDASLVLTLNPIPLSDSCPGKVLYDHKLELLDDITLRRDPQIHLERPTWIFGPAVPSVVDAMTTESLLADVDRYIDQFIVSNGIYPSR